MRKHYMTKQEVLLHLKKEIIDEQVIISKEEKQQELNKLKILHEELYDLNLLSVYPLTLRETTIIRKLYGIMDNGIIKPRNIIAKEMNLSISALNQNVLNIYHKLRRRVKYNLYNLMKLNNQERMTSMDLTLDKKNLRKKYLGELKLDNTLENQLIHQGINTIEDLLSLSIKEIKNLRGVGKSALETIVSKIHELGLFFIDELTDEEKRTVIALSSEKQISSSSIYWIKLSERKRNLYQKLYDIHTLGDLKKAILENLIEDIEVINYAKRIGLLSKQSITNDSQESDEKVTIQPENLTDSEKASVSKENLLRRYQELSDEKRTLILKAQKLQEEINLVVSQINTLETTKQKINLK